MPDSERPQPVDDGLEPVLCPTARLIVLDPADRVLLFKIEDDPISDPTDPRRESQPFAFRVTPGGGLDDGETFEEAALRELREETGLAAELGPPIFDREKLLHWNGQRVVFQERFFLVRITATVVSLAGLDALEQAVYREHRWWSLPELEATDETFFPTS